MLIYSDLFFICIKILSMTKKKKRTYGFKEILNIGLKGCKKSFVGYFIILFFGVLFNILNTYTLKVLVDVLKYRASRPMAFDWSSADILFKGYVYCFGGESGIDLLADKPWIFAIIMISVTLISISLLVWRKILQAKYNTKMGENLENVLFKHVTNLSYDDIKSMKNGDIIQICTQDEAIVRKFFRSDVPLIVYTIYIVLISYIILFITSWQIALICFCIMPILFIYSFFLIKEVRKRFRIVDDSEGRLTAKIEENLSSVRLVKAFNNEAYEINDFGNYIRDYKTKYMRWRRMSSFFFSSSDVFVFSQIALSTMAGAFLCYKGEITLGTYIISFTFVSQIVWPLRDVATILSNLAKASAALDRINLILEKPLEDLSTGITPLIKGNIEFKDVKFNFNDEKATKNTINGISFNIKEGNTIAIMGKTGSGKSTLAYLLTRLYEYTEGSIKVDGVELNTIQKTYLRKNIGIVLQEPFLFSKTILQNLKIANKEASNEAIIEAIKVAHIYDSINSFKDKYDTPVGEKGTTLSGGQKQRLAIARTLLTDAPILIFDDSLSAVDTETDFNIRKSIKERKNKATTILITHRVSTAKDANLIVVLDEGKIAQIGTHEELLKQDGLYKRIYDIQTKMV